MRSDRSEPPADDDADATIPARRRPDDRAPSRRARPRAAPVAGGSPSAVLVAAALVHPLAAPARPGSTGGPTCSPTSSEPALAVTLLGARRDRPGGVAGSRSAWRSWPSGRRSRSSATTGPNPVAPRPGVARAAPRADGQRAGGQRRLRRPRPADPPRAARRRRPGRGHAASGSTGLGRGPRGVSRTASRSPIGADGPGALVPRAAADVDRPARSPRPGRLARSSTRRSSSRGSRGTSGWSIPDRRSHAGRGLPELAALAARSAGPAGSRIVVGDMNTHRRLAPLRRLPPRRGLRDSRLGFGRQPSWPTWSPYRIAIDHAFVSDDLAVVDRRLGPAIGSDHFPLILDLAPAAGTRATERPRPAVGSSRRASGPRAVRVGELGAVGRARGSATSRATRLGAEALGQRRRRRDLLGRPRPPGRPEPRGERRRGPRRPGDHPVAARRRTGPAVGSAAAGPRLAPARRRRPSRASSRDQAPGPGRPGRSAERPSVGRRPAARGRGWGGAGRGRPRRGVGFTAPPRRAARPAKSRIRGPIGSSAVEMSSPARPAAAHQRRKSRPAPSRRLGRRPSRTRARARVDDPARPELGVLQGEQAGVGERLLAGLDEPEGDHLVPPGDAAARPPTGSARRGSR